MLPVDLRRVHMPDVARPPECESAKCSAPAAGPLNQVSTNLAPPPRFLFTSNGIILWNVTEKAAIHHSAIKRDRM